MEKMIHNNCSDKEKFLETANKMHEIAVKKAGNGCGKFGIFSKRRNPEIQKLYCLMKTEGFSLTSEEIKQILEKSSMFTEGTHIEPSRYAP